MYLLSLFVIFQFGRLQWILQRTPLPRHIILSRKCSKLPQRFVNFIWIASYSTFSVAQLAIKSVWHLDACKKSKNIKKYDVAQPLSLWFLRWPFNRVHPRISRLNMKALTWRFWCVKRLSKTTLKLAGWTNKTDGAWECGWMGWINGSRPGLVLLFFSFYSSPDSSVSPSVVGVCTLAKFSLFFRLYNCGVFDVWNGCQKLLCHISLPTFSREVNLWSDKVE